MTVFKCDRCMRVFEKENVGHSPYLRVMRQETESKQSVGHYQDLCIICKEDLNKWWVEKINANKD